MQMSEGPGFKFFNDLGGCVCIEMSEEPKHKRLMLNQYSSPTSKVKEVSWDPYIYTEDDTREPTPEELKLVVFEAPSIKLRSHACLSPSKVIEHTAPDGKYFTVKDMIKVICETEQQTRDETDWFGGVDIHHVFYEGLTLNEDVWTVSWGS